MNDLPTVTLNGAMAGIEHAVSNYKSNALTTMPQCKKDLAVKSKTTVTFYNSQLSTWVMPYLSIANKDSVATKWRRKFEYRERTPGYVCVYSSTTLHKK